MEVWRSVWTANLIFRKYPKNDNVTGGTFKSSEARIAGASASYRDSVWAGPLEAEAPTSGEDAT